MNGLLPEAVRDVVSIAGLLIGIISLLLTYGQYKKRAVGGQGHAPFQLRLAADTKTFLEEWHGKSFLLVQGGLLVASMAAFMQPGLPRIVLGVVAAILALVQAGYVGLYAFAMLMYRGRPGAWLWPAVSTVILLLTVAVDGLANSPLRNYLLLQLIWPAGAASVALVGYLAMTVVDYFTSRRATRKMSFDL